MSTESQIVVDQNKRAPGDVVQYISADDTLCTATVDRWIESVIIAFDTDTGKRVAFDQYDHIEIPHYGETVETARGPQPKFNKFGMMLTYCPQCGSGPTEHELRDYNMMWGDGEVYCQECGAFVRHWDRD